MNKNTRQFKAGDAVVLRLPDGTEQSAKVAEKMRHCACFFWRSGPGTLTQIWVNRPDWPQFVVAVFPPGVKFLAV